MIKYLLFARSHEIWQREILWDQPFARTLKPPEIYVWNGQTSVFGGHYFVQFARFPVFLEWGRPRVFPVDILSSCRYRRTRQTNGEALPSILQECFGHDCHIPSQWVDRYRDNKLSRAIVCFFWMQIVPHLIKFYDDSFPRRRLFISFFSEIPDPTHDGRCCNSINTCYGIKRKAQSIKQDGHCLFRCRSSSGSVTGKLKTAVFAAKSLTLQVSSILHNPLWRTFWTVLHKELLNWSMPL